jgi:hypothetical protein
LSNSKIDLTFQGYDGSGTAQIDRNNLNVKAIKIMSDKAGLNAETKDKLAKAIDDNNNIELQKSDFSSTELEKIQKVEQWYEDVDIDFDPSSDLKNGQKIKLVVKVKDEKSNPIKPSAKNYTVKGLKPIKRESTSKILDQIKVKFAGFEGKGIVTLKSETIKNGIFEVSNNGKLKNGQTVKITPPSDLFKKEGTIYSGKKYLEVKVSGLRDLGKIDNVDELKQFCDDLNEN